jgi:hypothetical protein
VPAKTPETSLADDLLSGVPKIAEFIGENERRTYYLLEQGLIPAGKVGTRWTSLKSRLREHYTNVASGRAA